MADQGTGQSEDCEIVYIKQEVSQEPDPVSADVAWPITAHNETEAANQQSSYSEPTRSHGSSSNQIDLNTESRRRNTVHFENSNLLIDHQQSGNTLMTHSQKTKHKLSHETHHLADLVSGDRAPDVTGTRNCTLLTSDKFNTKDYCRQCLEQEETNIKLKLDVLDLKEELDNTEGRICELREHGCRNCLQLQLETITLKRTVLKLLEKISNNRGQHQTNQSSTKPPETCTHVRATGTADCETTLRPQTVSVTQSRGNLRPRQRMYTQTGRVAGTCRISNSHEIPATTSAAVYNQSAISPAVFNQSATAAHIPILNTQAGNPDVETTSDPSSTQVSVGHISTNHQVSMASSAAMLLSGYQVLPTGGIMPNQTISGQVPISGDHVKSETSSGAPQLGLTRHRNRLRAGPQQTIKRGKCGVMTKEEASKYKMTELMPGSGVYIHPDHILSTLSRVDKLGQPSGPAMARYLLSVFYRSEELANATLPTDLCMSKGDYLGKKCLDHMIIGAIRAFCMQHANCRKGQINRALFNAISSSTFRMKRKQTKMKHGL